MLKKIIICLLFLALAMPAMADNSSTTSASTNQDKNEGKGGDTADKGEAETKTGGKSGDRKSTRLNSSHKVQSRMPSSA